MIAPAYYMYVYNIMYTQSRACMWRGRNAESWRGVLIRAVGNCSSREAEQPQRMTHWKLQSGLGDSGNKPALFQGDGSHTI